MAITTVLSTATFRDGNDALFNPTTVTCTVYEPDGTSTVYTTASVYPPATITNPSTGVYILKIDIDHGDPFTFEWHGENTSGQITEFSSFGI